VLLEGISLGRNTLNQECCAFQRTAITACSYPQLLPWPSLTVARSYIRKLLEILEIQHFLNAQYADVLNEFIALVELESL
jgi:hypothetical protein